MLPRCEVLREPVGKRVTARIALPDALGGDATGHRPCSSRRSPSAPAFTDGLTRSGALQGAIPVGQRSGRTRCRRAEWRHRPVASRATATPTSPTSSGSTSVTFSVSRLPHPAENPRMTAPPRTEQAGDCSNWPSGQGWWCGRRTESSLRCRTCPPPAVATTCRTGGRGASEDRSLLEADWIRRRRHRG